MAGTTLSVQKGDIAQPHVENNTHHDEEEIMEEEDKQLQRVSEEVDPIGPQSEEDNNTSPNDLSEAPGVNPKD